MTAEISGSTSWGVSPYATVIAIVMTAIVVDIVRHDVKVAPKWAWVAATVLLFPVGPILYLLWGRIRAQAAA